MEIHSRMKSHVILCAQGYFFIITISIVSSYFQRYVISFRIKTQKVDKSQDALSHGILFDSNTYFPSTSRLFLKVSQEGKLIWTKKSASEREIKGRWNKYQASEWSWKCVLISLKPQVKHTLASIPKIHLSCVKKRTDVRHKVLLVVYSHNLTYRVMLICKKTGLQSFLCTSFNVGFKESKTQKLHFKNQFRNLTFCYSLKNTICGHFKNISKVSAENQKNSPNFWKKIDAKVCITWISHSVTTSFNWKVKGMFKISQITWRFHWHVFCMHILFSKETSR